jgi:hypothetical protein
MEEVEEPVDAVNKPAPAPDASPAPAEPADIESEGASVVGVGAAVDDAVDAVVVDEAQGAVDALVDAKEVVVPALPTVVLQAAPSNPLAFKLPPADAEYVEQMALQEFLLDPSDLNKLEYRTQRSLGKPVSDKSVIHLYFAHVFPFRY